MRLNNIKSLLTVEPIEPACLVVICFSKGKCGLYVVSFIDLANQARCRKNYSILTS